VPGPQGLHETLRLIDVDPAGQSRHASLPAVGWYVSGGQSVQDALPTAE
jgi:hypothetical protein